MQSVRVLFIAGLAVAMLSACNPSGNPSSTSSTASPNPAASSDPTGSAEIEVPEIAGGEINSQGDLCDMIPVDVAAEILDVPSFTCSTWEGELNPNTVDACTFVNFDDMGTSEEADDRYTTINIVVLSNVDAAMFENIRQATVTMGREVTDYNIEGFDEAFYSDSESNIHKGDRAYALNVAIGSPSEEQVMALLTMVANADS